MNKKGAIEFSMTTIMVIIIGVAVLALGLAWVRGAFKQVTEISDIAFEEAKTQLTGELNTAKTIIVAPSGLSLGANDQKTVSVGCYNNANDPKSASLDTVTGTNVDVIQSKNPTNDIEAGGKAYWGLVIKAKSSVTSTTPPEVLTLSITCNGKPKEDRPLTITYK